MLTTSRKLQVLFLEEKEKPMQRVYFGTVSTYSYSRRFWRCSQQHLILLHSTKAHETQKIGKALVARRCNNYLTHDLTKLVINTLVLSGNQANAANNDLSRLQLLQNSSVSTSPKHKQHAFSSEVVKSWRQVANCTFSRNDKFYIPQFPRFSTVNVNISFLKRTVACKAMKTWNSLTFLITKLRQKSVFKKQVMNHLAKSYFRSLTWDTPVFVICVICST